MSVTARVASWSDHLVVSPKTGKITKAALRAVLTEAPERVEFVAVPGPFQRGGAFTLAEVAPATVMVRFNGDRDVAVVTVTAEGKVSVR